jgi:hypothetical protein
MKNGGWLDSYDDKLQLGGYVYPVNYVPQAENGIEGTMGGLTDKGFDYNGAWGGTMQDGGSTKAQIGIRLLPYITKAGLWLRDKGEEFGKAMVLRKETNSLNPSLPAHSDTLYAGNKYRDAFMKTPNIRTTESESFKKGHSLTNEQKAIVLHHTGYTDDDSDNGVSWAMREVDSQFRKPGESSHVVIDFNGNRYNYANPNQVTFHAGKSQYNNKNNVNDFGVGVEFQGDTDRKPLTKAQIESFIEYAAPIIKKNKLSINDIISHKQIRSDYMKNNPKDKDVESKPDINDRDYIRIQKELKNKKIFQLGGSLPGAVGFTYARTKGIPSEGPYAKKTKASAQDGTSAKKPVVKLSPEELKMERLKQYAQQQSRKEQSTVQSRGSMPDAARKQLYKDAQNAELKNQLIKGADIATDVMQVGNFIPNPIGQAIGNAGNILGGWIDSYEALNALNEGDYGDAAINAASVALPMGLGSSTFRRNSKYLQPGQPLHFLKGNDRVKYIEPFTKVKGMTDKSLLANRALLGTLGAETAYDSYQNGGEMKFYQEGLDWKPRNISRDGSVIKDDRGQWAHPGEITEIGSNQITMKGVPYPVLGVSDTGDTQMMYPGEDYKFKGKKVTEYPVSKKWLEKYK